MRRLVRPFVLLKLVRPPVLLFALACTAVPAPADEGMWLVSHPPREILAQRHGFEPTAAWLEHMQKSAVRMDASGSLVSRDGLVMTNHHVGSTQLERLSTAERDLLRDGFLARTRDAELRCPDMAMQVLWRIEDVTERVSAAVAAGLSPADAFEARRRVLAEIEQEARQRTGLDCEVVTLYGGARQHLYGYRRYTDVRLVMAPEMDIAFFGGDTDNFEYPRYDLDVCFFRIYENGEPLKAEHYLRWSAGGAADGDLVFVFGHPYRTQRLHTVAHLRFLRDVELPEKLRSLWRREVKLAEFRQRGPEQARVAGDEFFGVQNSRKALTGILQGLHDPELIAEKQRAETLLREVVPARGGNAENDPWDRIERALLRYREFFGRQDLLNGRYALRSELLEIALGLVRLADELPKPSAERLPEYRDAELESVYLQLYSPAPINLDLEAHRIASGLSLMAERLGADDALVAELLDGRSPTARAAQLVRGTTLVDVAARRQLAEGGAAALAASTDELLAFARRYDRRSRELRERYEREVESELASAYQAIAAARFERFGEEQYPDATSTLRMSFGLIGGYEENGRSVPAFTDLAGLYRRHAERAGQPGFALPPRWLERRERLRLETPFNFVCSADIIGGNSGSPVVNRSGEVVGLVFDGNIHGLVWDIAFTETRARAVAVDSRAIIEALREMYDARELVAELTGR